LRDQTWNFGDWAHRGFSVPALSYGCGTFGGKGDFFREWGTTDDSGARRLVDICLEAGVSMFDTADVYSAGESERILGTAIKGRRDKVIVSTKRHSAPAPAPMTSARRAII